MRKKRIFNKATDVNDKVLKRKKSAIGDNRNFAYIRQRLKSDKLIFSLLNISNIIFKPIPCLMKIDERLLLSFRKRVVGTL